MNKAVFFDKDGVLNLDKGIAGTSEEFSLYEHTPEIIEYVRNQGYKVFVITNQPIVARGILTESKLNEILIKFKQTIENINKKAIIEKIYYCPHHPNANVEVYRVKCECRKPRPGMLLKAKQEFDIDLSKSYMVGDRPSDIIAGSLAGCRTIQILSGMHSESMIQTDLKLDKEIKADFVINDIIEIKGII